MKMKIFKSSDPQVLEKTINEWLQIENARKIHRITHTNNEQTVYITVWWSE
jgi:hypothetical protein